MCLQPAIDLGSDARIEILGRLRGIPAQLPTTLAPSTSIDSHPKKGEPVRLGVQVRLAQLDSLWRCQLPTGVKFLGDRLDHSELLVLPTLKVIVPVTARRRLFPRHDRVEENVVELADWAYFKINRGRTVRNDTASVPSSMRTCDQTFLPPPT